ncbi:hypothetical protein RUM44_013082 [Polyplax serrata]|uniref:Protein kinase domain-containing protein n=1 Tax=Polyplax serrata TaxID=468196 RepID=A0ABR1BD51_POLSC
MASVPEIGFLRKPRVGPAHKVRPVMKLEWDRLLAEATEKDFEVEKDVANGESYYDDDDDNSDVEKECGTEQSVNAEERLDERPLNLCNKSHTMPMSSNNFPPSMDVLDLSAKKKKDNKKNRVSNENKKQNPLTAANFQFNNDQVERPFIQNKNVDNIELSVENKENYSGNYLNSLYSTPCNKKQVEELMDNKFASTGKIKSYSKTEEQNQIYFSEERQSSPPIVKTSKNNSIEKVQIKKENSKKMDCITRKEKNNNSQKASVCSEHQGPTKVAHVSTPITQKKFAVPMVPKQRDTPKTLTVNKKSYQILAPLGKGGSSKVYLVLNSDYELLAVKCVRLSDVSESTKNDYLNEIQHLMKMQHCKHVIKLYDHQYLSSQKILLAVMERGETDLSRFLKDKASSDEGISAELIMYYWMEMLMAVKSIHDNNIIHRDLKPANFLLVSGRLKLIDFGIASSIQTEQTSILMESQSGTFNYMSPEALQDLGFENKIVLKIGRKTDVWSLGCILYYFLYKKTPYQDLAKPIQKLRAITDPNYVIPFPKIDGVPDILIDSCKKCLIHDTKKRASIEELLAFRNRPLFSLSQVLGKLKNVISAEEYNKAEKAFEESCKNYNQLGI